MASRKPKTILLEIYNDNKQSDYEKAEVEITTTSSQTILHGQDHHTETMPTADFLKKHEDYQFENPILTEKPAKKEKNTFLISYSNPDELYLAYRKLFASLLHSPGENCQFKISPTEAFKLHKKDQKIHFSLYPNKRARHTLTIPILENILTKWREVYFGSALAGYTMRNKFHYCEHLLIDEEFAIDELPINVDTSILYMQDEPNPETVNESMHKNIELRFIDENVGFGLFARNEIEKGSPVIAYFGQKTKEGSYPNNTYAMSNADDLLELCTDGSNFGNMALYINHASSNAHGNPTTVTSNIEAKSIVINGVNQTIYTASRRIPKGAQLLFDYGNEYWNNHKAFHFTGRNVVVDETGKKLKRSLPHYRKMIRYMAGQGIREAQIRIAAKIIAVSIGLSVFVYGLRLAHISRPTFF